MSNANTQRRDFLKKLSITSAGVAASSLYSPNVFAKSKKHNWKMVTTWPKNFPGLGTGVNYLAKNINTMSDGRINIKVYGAGELVPAMGVFDAVSRGTAQMGHGASYYWQGKHPATPFFAAIPFGMNTQELIAWVNYGGGQQLWDDLYKKFGVKAFLGGNTGVQMGGWFNKEIKSIADFKGLKMRMPGLGGEVLRKLGATVVTLPGGELFQALKSGAIDATEWVGPYNDLAFGFHKAAKFYYWPGWHEPTAGLECLFNLNAFNELSKDLQQIVKVACESAYQNMMSEFTFRNQAALDILINKHKVKLKKFPDAVLKELKKQSDLVVLETSKKDAISAKIYKSYSEFQNKADKFNKISEEAYSLARSL